MNTFLLWFGIFVALLIVAGVCNEISYRVHRFFWRRSLDNSTLWDLKKRRGQIR